MISVTQSGEHDKQYNALKTLEGLRNDSFQASCIDCSKENFRNSIVRLRVGGKGVQSLGIQRHMTEQGLGGVSQA